MLNKFCNNKSFEAFIHSIVKQTMECRYTAFSLDFAADLRIKGIVNENGNCVEGIQALINSMIFHEANYELILSATVYCIKIKKDTNASTKDVSYKIAFENSYKKNIFNISVYNNGTMLMNNDSMKLQKLISILDEAYKNHCE